MFLRKIKFLGGVSPVCLLFVGIWRYMVVGSGQQIASHALRAVFFHKSQHSEKKITRSRSLSTYTYSFKIALFKTKEGNIKHNKNNKINCSKVDCDKNKCSLSIHYLRHLTCLRWWPQSLAPWQHWPWSWSLLALSSTEWESDRLAQVGTAKPAWRKEILMAY